MEYFSYFYENQDIFKNVKFCLVTQYLLLLKMILSISGT